MKLLAFAIAALAALPALAAPPGWLGRYVYEQPLGRGPAVVDHILTLGPKHCALETRGPQTFENVVCDVQWNGNAVTVTFVGFDDRDPDANRMVARRYRPGEPLLTLTKTPSGLMTTWQGYSRAPKGARPGRYFR